jgi:MFS family permease
VRQLWGVPDYRRVWTAATVSSAGSYVTVLALQVLAVVTLRADAVHIGLINAAQWVPYLLFGLVVGVVTDRHRRKPVLVGAQLGRGAVLALIPGLYALGWLTVWSLLAVVLAFGVLSLFFDSANQAFLPQVLAPAMLSSGFARLEQSDAAAQTAGPLLGAGLVRALGAPLAVLVDTVSYLVSAVILAGITIDEPVVRAPRGRLWSELREGVAWVYRHRTLAPLAWSGHVWFLAHSMLSLVFVLLVLRGPAEGGLGLGTLTLGISYACAGLGAVAGGAFAVRIAHRFGNGVAMIGARVAMPLMWLPVVLVGPGRAAAVTVCLGQGLYWLAMGAESGNELGYRNAVTPGRLQARMNTTMRSLNRAAVVIGAPLCGLVADLTTYRTAICLGIGVMLVSALVLAVSPFRAATMADALTAEPAAA